jgi:hypothetical protein
LTRGTRYELCRPGLFDPARLSSNSQRIRDAVDVVEPGRDQRDLKNAAIVEADGAQPIVIRGLDPRGIARDLLDVLEHHAILL